MAKDTAKKIDQMIAEAVSGLRSKGAKEVVVVFSLENPDATTEENAKMLVSHFQEVGPHFVDLVLNEILRRREDGV